MADDSGRRPDPGASARRKGDEVQMDADTRRWLEKIERKLDVALERQAQNTTALAVAQERLQAAHDHRGRIAQKVDTAAHLLKTLREDFDRHAQAERVERRVLAGVAAGVGSVITVVAAVLSWILKLFG